MRATCGSVTLGPKGHYEWAAVHRRPTMVVQGKGGRGVTATNQAQSASRH